MSHAREMRIAAMIASMNFMEILDDKSLAHDNLKIYREIKIQYRIKVVL